MTHSALLLAALSLAGLHTQPAPNGVSNYTRIDATVACAGATTVDAIPKLKAEGFKTIVNLRLMVDRWPVDKARDEAVGIGMSSDRLKNFALDYFKAHGKA